MHIRRIVAIAGMLALLAIVVAYWPGSDSQGQVPGKADQITASAKIDFNREIRPIISNNCYMCHGPDEKERKGDLRLDTEEGALAAMKPGKPHESSMYTRIISTKGDVMPPKKTGKTLNQREKDLIAKWIEQGGKYAKHWSYVPPLRPEPPKVSDEKWVTNPIDRFIYQQLEREKFKPQPEADRHTLIRRLALDLTGLPPRAADVKEFLDDQSPNAYEKVVDKLLKQQAFGEHWARLWLDLARYADSAGYADDPLRVIWAYRDYVINSFNKNKPFDQFTVEQIAGDLLDKPTDEQLIATAFNRNTLTNNEGGTNDEEYRSVAVVDRVNTTLTTWMGTSIACCQCHTHKYDPITQKEYFQLFAILNNTADADRGDESPLHRFMPADQKAKAEQIAAAIADLEKKILTAPGALAGYDDWKKKAQAQSPWVILAPKAVASKANMPHKITDQKSVLFSKGAETDQYTIDLAAPEGKLTGLRLQALRDPSLPGGGPGFAGGNFVLSRVKAEVVPSKPTALSGRYIRVELPGTGKMISLAEVQAFSGTTNVALKGKADQSTTDFEGPAKLAIDGKTDGIYANKSVSHTTVSKDPWWEVDLLSAQGIDKIVIWNRNDGGTHTRLNGAIVKLLDEKRQVVWQGNIATAPLNNQDFALNGSRPIEFASAFASAEQGVGFTAASLLDPKANKNQGWAIAGFTGSDQQLTLVLKNAVDMPKDSIVRVTMIHESVHKSHTLGHFKWLSTADPAIANQTTIPGNIVRLLQNPKATADDEKMIQEYYLKNLAPGTATFRTELAAQQKLQADLKPVTVPIMQELTGNSRRKTKIQLRGNFMDLGEEVGEGVPSVFNAMPPGVTKNRLALAKWLIDPSNPLTARVTVNRFWEQIFGQGLVRTSEEFGSQGELPSHPELLDWLATEFIAMKWDTKAFIKMLVMSSTYRQSAKVNAELLERDPDNRWLSRGPRVRLTAEMIRDQALAVSGLLSSKLGGPSVKPPQPALGLNAAFGGAIDWKTSTGEDRYRRGLYTEWRRSNPYPSMITFDAPNRDVCTVRRPRTNTPLQALVTMNDPVYIEAAQALARKALIEGGATPATRAKYIATTCLTRPVSDSEVSRIVKLFNDALEKYKKDLHKATKMATDPIGPGPKDVSIEELAAWTVVATTILNLDEMMMKR